MNCIHIWKRSPAKFSNCCKASIFTLIWRIVVSSKKRDYTFDLRGKWKICKSHSSLNPHMGLKFMFQIMHGRFAPNFLVAEVTLNYHSTCNQSRRWRRSRSNTNDTLHTGTKNEFCVQKINLDKILLSGIFQFFAQKIGIF